MSNCARIDLGMVTLSLVEELKILVVDDQIVNCKLARRALGSISPSVDYAISGEEATKLYTHSLYQGKPYHLVLMDFQIPGLDGPKITRRIKELFSGIFPQTESSSSAFPQVTVRSPASSSTRSSTPCSGSRSLSSPSSSPASPSPLCEYSIFPSSPLASQPPLVIGYSGNEDIQESADAGQEAGMCGYIVKDGDSLKKLAKTIEQIVNLFYNRLPTPSPSGLASPDLLPSPAPASRQESLSSLQGRPSCGTP